MSGSEIVFEVVACEQCPFYEVNDEFRLSGNAPLLQMADEQSFVTSAVLKLPFTRKACRALAADLIGLLVNFENVGSIPTDEITCSGCQGSIRLHPKKGAKAAIARLTREKTQSLEIILDMLGDLEFFRVLDPKHFKEIVGHLKVQKYPKGTVILEKGSPAENLYVIFSGVVEVLNEEGVPLSSLKEGDVFGEMSLISGDPVAATIKVVEDSSMIVVSGQNFKHLLDRFPALQLYMTRLLTQRLAKANASRHEDEHQGVSGRLAELPPAELTQTLNMNQKTGKVLFSLSKGPGEVIFVEGEIVSASYDGEEDKEAFFKILLEREGHFKFCPVLTKEEKMHPVLGNCLVMLLEGMKRIDEAAAKMENLYK